MLEQRCRVFLRDPVTAGEHGARDVVGVQLIWSGMALQRPLAPIASTGMASGVSRWRIVGPASPWNVRK